MSVICRLHVRVLVIVSMGTGGQVENRGTEMGVCVRVSVSVDARSNLWRTSSQTHIIITTR